MTLLDSVNYLRRMMREEEVPSVPQELDGQTQVGLLNDAADEILTTHRWSFLRRHDGYALFPGRFQMTDGVDVNHGVIFGLFSGTTPAWGATQVGEFSSDIRSRVVFPDDASFGSTSMILLSVSTSVTLPFRMTQPWPGSTGTGVAADVFAFEYVLPATVRQVLAVWDQEGDLPLEFVQRAQEFDTLAIRPHDHFSDRPEIVMVGGTYTTTRGDSMAGNGAVNPARTGTGLVIWPPPSADVLVQYSYVYKHAELSQDSDEWEGVPSEVIRLIERVAFEHSLDTNVEDDAVRARLLHAKNQRQLQRLLSADAKDPNRRLVPHEIGARHGTDSPHRRWESRTVPGP